jgi:predicted transcriptional regulator
MQRMRGKTSRMGKDSEKIVSFRTDPATIDELDSLAASNDRPRSYLINEAITSYLKLHAYQDELVRKGLDEMKRGLLIPHEVKR